MPPRLKAAETSGNSSAAAAAAFSANSATNNTTFYGISTTSATALNVLHELYIGRCFRDKLNKCSEAFGIELTCFSYKYELLDFSYTNDREFSVQFNATHYTRSSFNTEKLLYDEQQRRMELERFGSRTTLYNVQLDASAERNVAATFEEAAADEEPFKRPLTSFLEAHYERYWQQNPVCTCHADVLHRDFGFPLSDPRHYAFGVSIARTFPKELKRSARVIEEIDTDTSGVLNVAKDEIVLVNHALGRGMLFATRTIDAEGTALCMSGTIPESFVEYL